MFDFEVTQKYSVIHCNLMDYVNKWNVYSITSNI